jgi:hypothetical protein
MLLGVVVASVCLLAACSSGSKSGTASTGTGAPTTANPANGSTGSTVHVAKEATDQPSESAQMVCEPEAVKDIQQVIGIPAKVSTPKWDKETHTFSCDYVYPQGKMTLTVREFDNADETTAYYNQRATDLGGKDQDLQGLGQGGFTTKNGDTVIRKDYKVLTIDTTKLPAQFGSPPDTRANDGINVAATIMGCWTGA